MTSLRGRQVEGEEFIRRMRAGDRRVFDELMPLLLRLTYAACSELRVFDERRDDLAQEVALKVFGNWDRFEGHSRLATWIYSIARNAALDLLQSAHARRELLRVPVDGQDEAPGLWSGATLSDPAQALCVQGVINQLEQEPPARAGSRRKIDVIRWWVENSPTTEELAEFLQTSTGAARERKRYILEQLRALCRQYCGTPDCSFH